MGDSSISIISPYKFEDLETKLVESSWTVRHIEADVTDYSLRIHPDNPDLGAITDAIKPFTPKVEFIDSDLNRVELLIGGDLEATSFTPKLKVHSRSRLFNRLWEEKAETTTHLSSDSVSGGDNTRDTDAKIMHPSSLPQVYRDIVKYISYQMGVVEDFSEDTWGDENDADIYVYLSTPDDFDPKPHLNFRFYSDLDAQSDEVNSFSEIIGKTSIIIEHRGLNPSAEPIPKFILNISNELDDTEIEDINIKVKRQLESLGVNLAECPLEFETVNGVESELTLPLGFHQSGDMPPYAGENKQRWLLRVLSDDPSLADEALGFFASEGYRTERLDPQDDMTLTRCIVFGAPAWEAAWEAGAKEGLLTSMDSSGLFLMPAENYTIIRRYTHNPIITVHLPKEHTTIKPALLSGIEPGKLRIYGKKDHRHQLSSVFRDYPVKVQVKEDDDNDFFRLTFGVRPYILVKAVEEVLRETYEIPDTVETDFVQRWSGEDTDIFAIVPSDCLANLLPPSSRDPSGISDDVQRWVSPSEGAEGGAFIEMDADVARIGETDLPRRDRAGAASTITPPSRDEFALYCLDQNTAVVLQDVASCVASKEPCLLEGETATSKTSIIRFLAHLLGQPVKRINLNGQTDTGELIGRFVPDDRKEAESQWRWVDGDIVNAMIHGWWVILDEVNLAEPQILERLNSLLENPPSLSVTEHSPSKEYGISGGNPIHPDFRIFATMNPAEYTGRTAFSPAYKDRWTGYSFVIPPKEEDYLAMLRMWISGKTPNVHVLGRDYTGTENPAPLTSLGAVTNVEINDFITLMARFHFSMAVAASDTSASGLGRGRKERPVFTRRVLARYMQFIDDQITADSTPEEISRVIKLGLRRYYLSRLTDDEDRQKLIANLDGLGIGLNIWKLWIN